MRPTRIQLINFMSYKRADIDLSALRTVAIVGENGAGKSTILQAVTYCLWGKVRTASHNDVVRRGTTKCSVRLDFEHDGQSYQVTRRRDLHGNGSSDLEIALLDGEVPYPLTGPTIRETQGVINGVLGLSYDVFVSSTLLQQGEAGKFSNARPGERKDLLGQILDLGSLATIEKGARVALTTSNAAFRTLATLLDTAKERAINAEGGEEDLAQSTEWLNSTELDIIVARDHLKQLQLDLAEVAAVTRDLESLLTSKGHLNGSLATILDEIVTSSEKARNAEGVIEKEAEIRASYERYKELRAELEILDKKKYAKASADITRTQIDVESATLKQVADTAPKHEAKIAALNEEIESSESMLATMRQVVIGAKENKALSQKEIDRLSDEIEEVALSRAVATTTQLALREKLDLLSDDICPTCEQEIPEGHGVLQDTEDEILKLESMISDLEDTLRAAHERTSLVRQDIEKLQAEIARDDRANAAREVEIEGQEREVERLTDELAVSQDAAKVLSSGNFALELRTKLRGLEEESLGYNKEEHEGAKREMEELQGAGADLSVLETAKSSLAESLELKGKKELARDKAVGEIVAIEYDERGLQKKIANLQCQEELSGKIEDLEQGLLDLENTKSSATTAVALAEAKIKASQELEAQIERMESELEELNGQATCADLLVKAAGKGGAQALIVEAALPQIERDANEYLSTMSPNMTISLESQRTTQSGSVSETLDIRVQFDGMDAPIETLSGGERFRSDLALRLAIGQMLARRSGTEMKFLAIDEGFGSQDTDGQEGILEIISSLSALFDLIMVISHVSAVAASIGAEGSIIRVSKPGNASMTEVM